MRQDNEYPLNCQNALRAIETDPLNLPPDALEHVLACPSCSEVRVMWLAQDDFDSPIAPAGYFDSLPYRVLQKLPVSSNRFRMRTPLLLSAASMILIASAGGYWFGRQSMPAPMIMEAVLPPRDMQDILQDTTSFSSIELFSQVQYLTQEETNALMEDLIKPEISMAPAKIEED